MRLEGKRAEEFVLDVRAKESDVFLMRKYGLSAKGLIILKKQVEEIFKQRDREKENPPVRVNAKALLEDIRAGKDDDFLMDKYKITNRQLQQCFRKIIDVGLTSALELSQRLCITKSQVSEAIQEADSAISELD
jgi:hypothetical protein